MKTISAFAITFLALISAPAYAAVTFDWATVGNPDNADDIYGYGGVDYAYRISKHEVTNAQYTEFLNAVDPNGTNSLALYSGSMSIDAVGGINLNGGAASGSKYEIKAGRDNNPVVYVSFFRAMRFVNWLHNGQGSGGTETGAYTIGGGLDEVRSAGAKFWIPSLDEWYKAAYYDPNGNGGSGVYYEYPTGTDTEPYSDNPGSLNTPDDTNVANFEKDDSVGNGYDDGFAVTGSPSFVSSQNYLTDVGAYSLATSAYGTYDQGGNVSEWLETVVGGGFYRGLVGGNWNSFFGSNELSAGYVDGGFPPAERADWGFRVASTPEPSTLLFAALAAAGFAARRRASRHDESATRR
jgi:formylglycine-generating enzyme required for sulfatase activity